MKFKQVFSILWIIFLSLQLPHFNLSYAVEKSKNVKAAQEIKQPLTVEAILAIAVKNSDTFKSVMAQFHAIKREEYLSKIPTDINIRSQVGRMFSSPSS